MAITYAAVLCVYFIMMQASTPATASGPQLPAARMLCPLSHFGTLTMTTSTCYCIMIDPFP